MRLRKIGVCVIAVLALAGLSACRTKAGAAAVVGGHRISQSDVNKFVEPAFTLPSASDPAQQQEPPRVIALNTLIEGHLMTLLLEKSLGGVPTDGQLADLHDEALAVQLGVQQAGSQADQALSTALGKSGLKPAFMDTFVRQLELKQVVIDKIKAQRQSDIADAVRKLGVTVSVNGRYGTWSAANASLAGYTPPTFVTLGSSSSPAPAAG